MDGRYVVLPDEGKIMGVGAGLARWLNVDVLLVRLMLVGSLFLLGPVALVAYVLAGWLGTADR